MDSTSAIEFKNVENGVFSKTNSSTFFSFIMQGMMHVTTNRGPIGCLQNKGMQKLMTNFIPLYLWTHYWDVHTCFNLILHVKNLNNKVLYLLSKGVYVSIFIPILLACFNGLISILEFCDKCEIHKLIFNQTNEIIRKIILMLFTILTLLLYEMTYVDSQRSIAWHPSEA